MWQDPAWAEQWDSRHLAGNPARAEHLALLLQILEQVESGWIIDLGSGSGLVAKMILEQRPAARLFGVDYSDAMLALARERLAPFGDRARLAVGDLTAIDAIDAPSGCAAAIAVQSLHHLTANQYRSAVGWTYDRLGPGGWFFIIDRMAVPSEALYGPFAALRERQGQSPNPSDWSHYLAWLDQNGDRPLSVQAILRLLEEAHFESAALDVRGDRGMLVSRRF